MDNKEWAQKMSYKGSSFSALWAVLHWFFLEFFNDEIDHEKWEAAKAFLSANAREREEVFGDEASMRRDEREVAEKILQPTSEMCYVADLLAILVQIMNRQSKIDVEIELLPDSFTIKVVCDTKRMIKIETNEIKVDKNGMTIYYVRGHAKK